MIQALDDKAHARNLKQITGNKQKLPIQKTTTNALTENGSKLQDISNGVRMEMGCQTLALSDCGESNDGYLALVRALILRSSQ